VREILFLEDRGDLGEIYIGGAVVRVTVQRGRLQVDAGVWSALSPQFFAIDGRGFGWIDFRISGHHAGRSRTLEGNVVAAVCCCRRRGRIPCR
jgi:hypothetical protein